MKRIISLLFVIILSISLTACGNSNSNTSQGDEKNDYSNIVSMLEEGNYDGAIYEINMLKEEAKKAENANKGILEIEITAENWSEYFETTDKVSYQKNNFDEIEYVNVNAGLKLKENYTLAEEYIEEIEVAFEVKCRKKTADMTIDYQTGEYSFANAQLGDMEEETFDNTYHGWNESKVVGFGYMEGFERNDGENTATKNVNFYEVAEVHRVQGTIYIYGE